MSAANILKVIGGGVVERIIDRPMDIIQQNLEFYNERKNKEQEQKLRQEEAKFQQELEIENRKRNAEIDALIAEKEIERNAKIAESISNHQKIMAECSVSIGKSLGLMNVELRERATSLVMEKQKQYKELQDAATEKAMTQLENIVAKFPEGSKAGDMMTDAVIKQLNNIIDTSNKFMQTIDEDFSKMMDSIGRITEKTITNANQYISPTFAKAMVGSSSEEDASRKLLR